MQPVASGFGPVALKMEFKKMRSDPVAFCDRLQNRTGPDFETLILAHANHIPCQFAQIKGVYDSSFSCRRSLIKIGRIVTNIYALTNNP